MEGHFHFRANFQPPWQKRIDSYKTGKLTLESRSPVGMKRAFTTTATDQGNNPRTDAPKLREDMCESKETSANTAQIVTSSCYKEESMQHYSAPKLPACYAISFANKNQPQVTPYKVLYCKRSLKKHKTYQTSGTQVPGFCQQGQTPSCENEPVDARVGEGGASVLFYEHYDSGPNDWQCEAPRKASEGSNAVASSGLVPLGEDFIDKKLRPHQKMGLHWMHSRIAAGGGCILADTMGLGKTLQALALLWSLLREHVVQHNAAPFKTLIVCPTSLKTNWRTGTLPNEKTFKKVFLEPIIRGCRPEATETEVIIGLHRTNWGNGFLLCKSSGPLLVPRKRVVTVHVELSPMHKLAYNDFCKECLTRLEVAKTDCLGILTTLRRLVNVPEMFVTDQFASRELLKNGIQDEEDAELTVLDKVESLIKKETWSFLRLDGSTPQPLRGSIVDKFNTDLVTRVFLLSSKAGGTGLNLTGANRLIHMDPDCTHLLYSPSEFVSNADDNSKLIGAFTPGSGTLPVWLDGFHLSWDVPIIRRIELEVTGLVPTILAFALNMMLGGYSVHQC
ncbi:DNA repair and recombination protein [Cyclospora cayetanensis]|uniref:DNA repair and recombination protein n=1 Tax=Cyclospora cayetanensis TaxID=88456 RepID=A0A1D3D6Y8_9EIME|nr:DNA repair and recombination protein [Cyclospora cayetanensis]